MSSIEKLIERGEGFSLSVPDLFAITNGKMSFHTFTDLEKFDTLDAALGEHGAMIILYRATKNYGHYVAMFKVGNDAIEFFDPVGIPLNEELIPFEFAKEHSRYDFLQSLVSDSGYRLIENHVQLQENNKDINTCGRHAALRIVWRFMSLKRYQGLFRRNKLHFSPDWYVTALTLMHSLQEELGHE